MIISLCGYMGAGKSTIGIELSKVLNYTFVDVDYEIERKYNMSISDIFREYGEGYFRDIESKMILNYLDKYNNGELNNIILSLGGGAVISNQNRENIKKFSKLVFLDCPFDVCYNRIKNSDRPIVKTKSYDELKDHFISRREYYLDSDFIVNCNQSVDRCVSEIINFIGVLK